MSRGLSGGRQETSNECCNLPGGAHASGCGSRTNRWRRSCPRSFSMNYCSTPVPTARTSPTGSIDRHCDRCPPNTRRPPENYAEMKARKLFSAGEPEALGGGGASHTELCDLLRELARFCPSTALALSMHQHPLAAAVWRHLHGQPAESLLRRVAVPTAPAGVQRAELGGADSRGRGHAVGKRGRRALKSLMLRSWGRRR